MSADVPTAVGLPAAFREIYGRDPEILTRAPGRIEFIGNHTDYNGGPALGAAIDRSVWVALARRADGRRRFSSRGRTGAEAPAGGHPRRFSGAAAWASYPLGVLATLEESELPVPGGFDYLAVSDLPVGAGLSSSAAIEMASGLAFLEAVGARVPREVLVQAARRAENEFVGMPCGLLDQGVCGFGRRDHLVLIDSRTPSFRPVPMPDGVHFWIFNTHVKHALIDGLYAARREECMAAARALGASLLVEVTPERLEAGLPGLSPVAARRARHIVEEIGRVEGTLEALRRGDLRQVGRLLNASHQSSRTLFENSTEELDYLVASLGDAPGVYGARLMGGGFGGAAMAATDANFGPEQAAAVAAAYRGRFGVPLEVLHAKTADGAERIA